ncbi:MAG: nitrilase-related carbon-nitrogen hydrolase [Deltaproteobacteria bacterium]
MADRFTLALAQTSPKLADLEANLENYAEVVTDAAGQGADLVVFPELSLTGYHLKDDVPTVAARLDSKVVARLKELSKKTALVAGMVEESPDFHFYNSAIWFEDGEIRHVHRKVYLPTYGMFDENRYFARGGRIMAHDTGLARVATLVCEDFWHPSTSYIAALDGALAIVCPSSSPASGIGGEGEQDENARTWELFNRATAQVYGLFIFYANRVGFEDGVGFWGGSEVVGPDGGVLVKAPYYEPALVCTEIDLAAARRRRIAAPVLRDEDLDLTARELERIRRERR